MPPRLRVTRSSPFRVLRMCPDFPIPDSRSHPLASSSTHRVAHKPRLTPLGAQRPGVCPGTRALGAPLREQKWSVTISFLSGKCMQMQSEGGVANGPRGLFVSPGQREWRSWRRGVDSPVTTRYCWRLPRNAERNRNQRLAGRDQRYLTIEEERDRKVCGANSMILVPFGGEGRVQT